MKSTVMAAAAIFLVAGSSSASATSDGIANFTLSVSGAGTHWYVNGVPSGCNWGQPNDGACEAGYAPELWAGTVTVETASRADGTYSYGAGLLSLNYASNEDWFNYTLGDTQVLVDPPFGWSDSYLAGLVPGASVTIAAGNVVAIDATYVWWSDLPITFSGLTATDFNGGAPGQPDADNWNFRGTLTPLPEPTPAALFVLGMLAVAFSRTGRLGSHRGTRSRHAPRP